MSFKTQIKRLGVLVTALTCLFAADACHPKPQPSSEKVVFNMSWLPQGSMAGFILAIDKGFYARQGLDVSLIRGFGGGRTVNEMDHGLFQFGYVDPISIALNRAHGGKARMIGAINARWPGALCYIKQRHAIEKPVDLAGLTIGGGQNSVMQSILPTWLERNGVKPGQAKILQLDPAVVATSLIRGQVDAAECWEGNSLPLTQKLANAARLTLGRVSYRDFGLDIYGSGIATTDSVIAKNPDLVRKFLVATYQGYAAAEANPDEAVKIILHHFPLLDPEITRSQLDQTLILMHSAQPDGSIDSARMGKVIDYLRAAISLNPDVTAADLFTTKFLQSSQGKSP